METIDRKVSRRRKVGRKTDAERAIMREENRRRERYEAQEAKRAKRMQVDQNGTLYTSLTIAALATITSAVISFNGVTSIAATVGLAVGWMAWLFFGFIEGMILYFTLNYLIRSSRIDEATGRQDNAWGDFVGLMVFGAIAILANAYHTFSFHNWDFANSDTWAGVVLSVMAPVAIIWATKSASSTLFAKAVRM